MAENTKIGWTHGPNGEAGHTHNEVRGCAHAKLPDGSVHSGCENCYAEVGYGTRYGITWGEAYLGGTRDVAAESTRWKLVTLSRRAAVLGVFERVFMFSLGDVLEEVYIPPSVGWGGWPSDMHQMVRLENMFHAREVAQNMDEARARLWDFIRATVRVCGACGGSRLFHDAATRIGARPCFGDAHHEAWARCAGAKVGGLVPLLLTKRPYRAHLVPEDVRPFCALGGSVSDQPSADAIVPAVLDAQGFALRFLSMEPLVGPVNLIRYIGLGGRVRQPIGWAIIGGESGKGERFRPFYLDHARAVVAQAQAAGVKTYIKQMGELPVISGAEWENRGEAGRTHILKESRRDKAPPGTVPLLFTGTGTNPQEWAHLFGVPADELQQVPRIRTPAMDGTP